MPYLDASYTLPFQAQSETNRIVLEPEVYSALIEYVADLKRVAPREER